MQDCVEINNRHKDLQQKLMQEQNNQIITSYRRVYTVAQKVFCCKCFNCCQDVAIVNSHVRKQTLQRMIKNFVIDQNEITLYDPIKLMILIYLCADPQIPKKHIQKCRVNPNVGNDSYRTDLEFYIPQMCNYIVFHSDLNPHYLLQGLQKGCKMSFYFGHLYYFYMISLEKIINKNEVQILKKAFQYRQVFLEEMCKYYEGQSLSSIQLYGNFKTNVYPSEPEIGFFIKVYGTKQQISLQNDKRAVEPRDITLPRYSSIFSTQQAELFSFKSTINFFDDLFAISQQLIRITDNKKVALKKALMAINEKLPACVYIPFTKNSIRLCNVLNIVSSQCRIFSTKQRAPYYICIQVFSPAETLDSQQQQKYWEKVQTPFTFTQTFRSESLLGRRKNSYQRPRRTTRHQMGKQDHRFSDPYSESIRTEILSERQTKYLNNQLLKFANQLGTQPRLKLDQSKSVQLKQIMPKDTKVQKALSEIFGESQQQFKERIKNKSIFGNFESWNLVHLIVKTRDNLKQEQFALQLIYQFYYIFKLEKLPLILTPYQVLSMGPDYGIIQMVRESVTIDSLKKKLRTEFPKPLTLKQFFQLYFANNLAQAKQTFMKSLAAYSLVMYFLQAKDRHNGNILLHKSGKLLHIDFGFFLSNLPGKGVELQKVCPFKLLSEHLEVLDGPQSYYFKKFRQYFFLGFKAAKKHQNKILILVKMMYSSSGMTMPCFQKGQLAITQMEDRFNPPNVITDAQLNLHCQKLINSSLDNWRAKWYDRWQYLAQGIFY